MFNNLYEHNILVLLILIVKNIRSHYKNDLKIFQISCLMIYI